MGVFETDHPNKYTVKTINNGMKAYNLKFDRRIHLKSFGFY